MKLRFFALAATLAVAALSAQATVAAPGEVNSNSPNFHRVQMTIITCNAINDAGVPFYGRAYNQPLAEARAMAMCVRNTPNYMGCYAAGCRYGY